MGSGLPAQVQDMVVLNDTLYAIGNFSTPIMHVAKFDLTPAADIKEIPTADLRVYPNPCEEFIYFSENVTNELISVFDITGKVVMSYRVWENRLDTSHLGRGVYNLVVEGRVGSTRLLKL